MRFYTFPLKPANSVQSKSPGYHSILVLYSTADGCFYKEILGTLWSPNEHTAGIFLALLSGIHYKFLQW